MSDYTSRAKAIAAELFPRDDEQANAAAMVIGRELQALGQERDALVIVRKRARHMIAWAQKQPKNWPLDGDGPVQDPRGTHSGAVVLVKARHILSLAKAVVNGRDATDEGDEVEGRVL